MFYSKICKPLLDFFLALALLILFSPVLIITAILIYFKIGQPIFFIQKRPGYHEKIFKIYKFRTMSDERDNEGNLLPDEKRLKGIGKKIRSLSLDELPQLFNVLKGDMSFIGPRPLLIEYLPHYDEVQKKRHDVKPGITGWAQVNGRNAISWEKKFELDVYYVENLTCKLDLKIWFMTFFKVLKRSGVSADNHVSMEKFKGSDR